MNRNDLSRREVILRALHSAGFATLAGSTTLMAACASEGPRAQAVDLTTFSNADIAWLDEVAETILPETETPGAKAAQVGGFIALMVTDTYSPEEQIAFRRGMVQLDDACRAAYGADFMAANATQRLNLLTELDAAALAPENPDHYFSKIKELTALGYFTSEIGYTQAMRYVEVPGRYDPCVDLEEGGKIWARHA